MSDINLEPKSNSKPNLARRAFNWARDNQIEIEDVLCDWGPGVAFVGGILFVMTLK